MICVNVYRIIDLKDIAVFFFKQSTKKLHNIRNQS